MSMPCVAATAVSVAGSTTSRAATSATKRSKPDGALETSTRAPSAPASCLDAHKTPGRTHERTHYTLTKKGRTAIAEWARTPASLPRIQNEPVVRLLAADLVDPENVREGLEAMRAEIDAATAAVRVAQERFVPELPHRAHLLMVNHRYAERMLDLQRQWLAEAGAVLSGGSSRSSPPRSGSDSAPPG